MSIDQTERLEKLSPAERALLLKASREKSSRLEKSKSIPRRARRTESPLSFAQQRLWFFDQLAPNSPLYNIPFALRLSGELRVDVLRRTLTEIARRHDILRTRFGLRGDKPAQIIDSPAEVALPLIELSGLEEQRREEQARSLAREEAQRPFDLTRGPLWRTALLRLGDREHIALFTMHHAVSDDWSLRVLVNEVAALYEAYLNGEDSPLPEVEIQYADYAEWQREYLAGGSLEAEAGYWKTQLRDVAVLDLPTDHARPAAPSYWGGTEKVEIGKALSEGLKRLGQREGATLFMALMAAFKVLLMRYSGEEDLVVGTSVANRTRGEVEGVIGFFANTLAIRTDLSGNPSFRETIRRVREVALGAYAHQEAPFEKLVEVVNPERVLSRSPLFQVLMTLQNTRLGELEIRGLKICCVEWEPGTSKLDLTLNLTEERECLSGGLEYSLDLFEVETIRRMIRHFERLVAEVVRDAEQRIEEIELISAAEKRQIIEEWNETAAPYPQDRCIHELLADQAGRTPDRISLVGEGQVVSYRELNRRAGRLAAYLRRLGVGPEVVVGLCLGRSVEMVVAVLGVLKAGGAYLPLDVESPLERLSFILEDSGAGVVLTEQKLEGRLPAFGGQTICLDLEQMRINEERTREPESGVRSENLAYVIYTSGSTGRPKGVMAPHKGLCNLAEVEKRVFKLGDQSRVLQFASLSFDASVWEIFGALAAGGSLHIYARERAMPGDDLGNILREDQITTVTLPPTVLAALAQEELIHLQTLIAAGEACAMEIVEKWAGGRKFFDAYGPTEATVCASMSKCAAGSNRRPTIGRPIANTRIYILDREMKPVPIGVRGDLYLSGVGVTRGYLGSPGLTAERFVPNPFGDAGRERLYRTGDVARYLSDGSIEFIGRVDDQVKIRGYRIELGEIEAVLNEHPLVRQSAVVSEEDVNGSKRLVGYVAGGGGATVTELKRHVRERLPEYMVPETIILLGEMPVTASGKVDRKRLPQSLSANDPSGELGPKTVADQTPVEEIVAGIFKEMLRVVRIGRSDNFFEIGGHSLLATQLASRVRQTFGVEVGVRSMFEDATVAGMARKIEEAMRSAEKGAAPPLVRVSRAGGLPLSFAQQRLWFIDQLDPGNAAYNIPGAVKLKGRLDLNALERSVNEVVRRHEALRTRFEVEESKPVQVIDEWRPRRLEIADLTSVPREDRNEEVERIVSEEAETGFDLRRGPLLRVKVLKLDEDEHVLLYVMHHIVSDAWSMGILIREMGTLYRAYSCGEESPLEELPIQYADFSVWQREWLQGEALENQLAYWRRQLGEEPLATELPTDRPRPARQTHRGAQRTGRLPAALSDSLKALSLKQNCTLFMTLLAAFKILLSYLTGHTEITVGADIANRNCAEIENLIGFFVNQLALRAELPRNSTFVEFLEKVRAITLGAYAHQDLPFEKLVEALNPDRDEGRAPLFQVKVMLQNAPVEELILPELTLSPVAATTNTAKLDLLLNLHDTEDGLNTTLEYNTELFEESTARRILDRFRTLLGRIVQQPDARLQELVESLIKEDSREELKEEMELEDVRLRRLKSRKRRALGGKWTNE